MEIDWVRREILFLYIQYDATKYIHSMIGTAALQYYHKHSIFVFKLKCLDILYVAVFGDKRRSSISYAFGSFQA